MTPYADPQKRKEYDASRPYRNRRLEQKEYYRHHGGKERKQQWYANGGKIKHRFGQRLRRYGFSQTDFQKMFAEQEGKCAICQAPLDDSAAERLSIPHVDHDHKRGFIRGILCLRCNTGLGWFLESTEILERAIQYLRSFE
jgi:hypothetical protein